MGLPQLTHIDFDACPECGCREIGSIRIGNGYGSHTCGEWREFITFRCGAEYEYSPNFSKIINNKPCRTEGINEATIDIAVRLTLRIRKDADTKNLDPRTLFKVPGNDSYHLYGWQNHEGPEFLRKAEVIRVDLLKTSKLKKK